MKTVIKSETGVVILSGGNSERMNFPKCFLQFENKTLIEHLALIYCDAGISEPVIVLNSKFAGNKNPEAIKNLKKFSKIIENTNPEKGRLHSIKLGLNELKDKKFCFIQNVDNPYVTVGLLQTMMENKSEISYVSPSFGGKSGHPVLIGKKVIEEIIKTENDEITLKQILSCFKKNDVDSGSLNVLENINSPLDWENFKAKKNKCKA